MRILMIGGTGNISAACAGTLHDLGHEIVVLTRGRLPVPAGYRSIVADRYDQESMKTALRGVNVDVVVNALGYDLPELEIDLGLFAGAISQYIFISTAAVYAKPHRFLPLTEEHPLGNPFWEYGQKKQRCEEWLLDRHRQTGFPVTVVRPSHTYSQRWIPNPVASAGYTFAARLEQHRPVFVHDGGGGLWTLTAAGDFAAGLAGLVANEAAIGQAVHITSDEVLSWGTIYREIADGLGVVDPEIVPIPSEFICAHSPDMKAVLRGDKAEPGVFDNSRIRSLVPGFACSTSFRHGIREAVAWFRADPARQLVDHDANAIFDEIVSLWRNGPSAAVR